MSLFNGLIRLYVVAPEHRRRACLRRWNYGKRQRGLHITIGRVSLDLGYPPF
jgi:hypothetical protein